MEPTEYHPSRVLTGPVDPVGTNWDSGSESEVKKMGEHILYDIQLDLT